MDLTQGGSSTGQKFQKDINKTEKLEKNLTRRPIKIHMLGQEGCQEFQLNEQKCEERVKKVNKNKKSREAKKQETAPTTGNLDEPLGQKARLEKVLETE